MEIIKAFISYLISYIFTYYSIKYSLSDHILISTMNIGISALVAAAVTVFLSADLLTRKKMKSKNSVIGNSKIRSTNTEPLG